MRHFAIFSYSHIVVGRTTTAYSSFRFREYRKARYTTQPLGPVSEASFLWTLRSTRNKNGIVGKSRLDMFPPRQALYVCARLFVDKRRLGTRVKGCFTLLSTHNILTMSVLRYDWHGLTRRSIDWRRSSTYWWYPVCIVTRATLSRLQWACSWRRHHAIFP